MFHVATTRHTAHDVGSSGQSDGDEVAEPSRFIDEFANRPGHHRNIPELLQRKARQETFRSQLLAREMGLEPPATVELQEPDKEIDPLQVSVLSVSSFIAQMRRIAGSSETTESARMQAARQLARLAEEGVPGADPSEWWATQSVAEERVINNKPRLSPSRIEALLNCPLNALLSNAADNNSDKYHLMRGNLAHAYMEAIGRGADEELARRETVAAFEQIQTSPNWKRGHERDEFERLLIRTNQWIQDTRGVLDLVDVEVRVDVETEPGVRVTGYMDRLERAVGEEGEKGGLRVIDLKTGAYKPSDEETSAHPQLMAYQLVLSRGALSQDEQGAWVRTAHETEGEERDGATLVFPGTDTKKIATAEQARKEDEELAELQQSCRRCLMNSPARG